MHLVNINSLIIYINKKFQPEEIDYSSLKTKKAKILKDEDIINKYLMQCTINKKLRDVIPLNKIMIKLARKLK